MTAGGPKAEAGREIFQATGTSAAASPAAGGPTQIGNRGRAVGGAFLRSLCQGPGFKNSTVLF